MYQCKRLKNETKRACCARCHDLGTGFFLELNGNRYLFCDNLVEVFLIENPTAIFIGHNDDGELLERAAGIEPVLSGLESQRPSVWTKRAV